MVYTNFPPARRSFSAFGVCQSGAALFHFIMSAGVVHSFQTFSIGAFIMLSTVMIVLVADSIVILFGLLI
jgi:hypothetical protein